MVDTLKQRRNRQRFERVPGRNRGRSPQRNVRPGIGDECAQPDCRPQRSAPQNQRGFREAGGRPDGGDLLGHERQTKTQLRGHDVSRGDRQPEPNPSTGVGARTLENPRRHPTRSAKWRTWCDDEYVPATTIRSVTECAGAQSSSDLVEPRRTLQNRVEPCRTLSESTLCRRSPSGTSGSFLALFRRRTRLSPRPGG